jgi:leucyl/phenylalanyl-tRNA--protein transferase
VNGKVNLPRLGDDPCGAFPPTSEALESPNGLLAWGGDLRVERLLRAYQAGIFPWYTPGQPVLWWSPAPRCVIYPDQVHLSKRTRRRYNSGSYHLTMDVAFARVIKACAGPRRNETGTWITGEMREAYYQLHRLGHAHSLEVWDGDVLTGGIYGLAVGSVFFGESMFSVKADASKIALVALCRQLHQWDFGLLDCQVGNPHLFSMGAVEVSREAFEKKLSEGVGASRPAKSWKDQVDIASRW